MADSPADKLAEKMASEPILGPGLVRLVTDKISAIVLKKKPPKWWIAGFAVSFALVMLLMYALTYLLIVGVGIWEFRFPSAGVLRSSISSGGRNRARRHADFRDSAPVAAALAHSINRFAEAMTLFAVSCAGIFPLAHMGRPWLGYWLFPYPDTMKMWPNFRSPLVWDAFAVSTYASVPRCSGTSGCCPTLRRCAIARKIPPRKLFTACWPWAGAAPPFTGTVMRPLLAARRPGNAAGYFRAHHRQF